MLGLGDRLASPRLGVRIRLAELRPLGDDLGDQLLGLAAGGAVADGDDADLVLADQVLEEDLGLGPAVLGRRGGR